MLTLLALTLKKTITLFVLVGPVSMIPVFLTATESLNLNERIRFARTVGTSVAVALLAAGFIGVPALGLLDVSMHSIQVGGGIIMLLLAIAMVLGKEMTFKSSHAVIAQNEIHEVAIVPIAIPLLAGPASFSYVMGNSVWHGYLDLIPLIVPSLFVGAACWGIFRLAVQAERQIRRSTMDVVERVGGFILAAMAVEMMASGLRGLFPILIPG